MRPTGRAANRVDFARPCPDVSEGLVNHPKFRQIRRRRPLFGGDGRRSNGIKVLLAQNRIAICGRRIPPERHSRTRPELFGRISGTSTAAGRDKNEEETRR